MRSSYHWWDWLVGLGVTILVIGVGIALGVFLSHRIDRALKR